MALNTPNIPNRANINIGDLFSSRASRSNRTIPNRLTDLFSIPSNRSNSTQGNNITASDTGAAANTGNENNTAALQETEETVDTRVANERTNLGIRAGLRSNLSRLGQIVRQSVNLNSFNFLQEINTEQTLLNQQENLVENRVRTAASRNNSAANQANIANTGNRASANQINININVPRVNENTQATSFFEPSATRSNRYGALRNRDFTNITFRLNNALQTTNRVRTNITEAYRNNVNPALNIAERQEETNNPLQEINPTSRNELSRFSFQNSFAVGGRIDLFA